MYSVEPLYSGHLRDRKVSLIERCPHFRSQKMFTILMFGMAQAVLISRVSLFQGGSYFRGVLISGVSLFHRCPYFRCILISGVSLFQGCPYFRAVLISRVTLFQGFFFHGCPQFRCVPMSILLMCVIIQCTGQYCICICRA